MKARPLSGTLQGERLLGIDPALASQVAAGWRRRLNLFTGRALTEPALSLEQYGRESHLAIRGQRVSAGVVQGLEVVLGTGAAAGRLHLEPGYGIAASGEDVVVPAAGSYAIESLPVYAPATLLHPIEGGEEPPADSEETGGLLARRLSRMNLGELRAALGAEPDTRAFEAGILVAQPVTFHETAQPQEVCDDDQSARAFEDEVRIDGARLVLYAWPVEWLPLPAGGDQWRNRLAYAIFERERALAPDEVLPWEALGVPLALLGFDTAGAPLFADRAAVVRDGGKPRPRARLGRSHRDTPFLWQARMQQLGEHLAEPSLAGRPIDEVAREFRFLPPAGLLPRDAIDPVQRQGRFFPSAFRETAVPAPLEQLDVALESSAALAPYDLAVADDVELIVPVPQVWYEPRLLQTDEVSPAFQQAIDGFVERRGVWLLRREDLRGKADAIERAIRARERDWPDPDPGKIDPEEAVAESQVVEGDAQLSEPEAAYGTIDVQGELHVEALDELRARLAETPVRHFTSVPLTALPAGVTLPAGIPITHEGGSLAFRGLMTEAQRNTLLGLSSQAAYQQAVRALFDRSQRDDLSQLDRLGVEGFIQYLEGKVRRADDTLDLGFLNVQTDIYRIRQVMLGAEAATRLATSPALATIARGETAAATKDDLARFFETARGAGGAPLTTGPTGPSTPSGGAPGAATPGGGASEPLTNLRGFTTGAIARGVSETAFSAAFTPSIRDIAEGVAARPRPEVEIAAEQPAVEVPLRGGAQPLFRPEISKEVISGAAPIPGETYDFRTVTIAERLDRMPANEAKSFSVSTKYQVVSGVAGLDIAIDDLPVPGFKSSDGVDVTLDLGSLVRDNRIPELLAPDKRHDPDPADGDEAAFLSAGVRALENSVATLRAVEGRVQAYKSALELCRRTLETLNGLASQVEARLDALEDGLAEARHDVAVARALLAEETERIEAINARRRRILAEHVTFLAYRRPRAVSLRVDAPSRPIHPGLSEAPVPACVAEDLRVPPDITTMLDLMRDAPSAWFRSLSANVFDLRRPDDLKLSVALAKSRAQLQRSALPAIATAGIQSEAISKVFAAQVQLIEPFKAVRTSVDLAQIATASWTRVADQAKDLLSVGDLIDNPSSRLSQRAARELHEIGQVGTCLYRSMGEVPAAIRLEWATRLSQYDRPVSLRELTSLPRWGEIDFAQRRDAQALVDWLYSRIDDQRREAVSLMDDYVRVCILLASHAPVNQIISGRLPKPAVVRPGDHLDLTVLPQFMARLRVGMHAAVYSGANVAAVAVVRDISGSQVVGQVLQAQGQSVQLAQGATVQFAEAEALGTSFLAAPARFLG